MSYDPDDIQYHGPEGVDWHEFQGDNGISQERMDIIASIGKDATNVFANADDDVLQSLKLKYEQGDGGRIPNGFRHKAVLVEIARRMLEVK